MINLGIGELVEFHAAANEVDLQINGARPGTAATIDTKKIHIGDDIPGF